MQNIQSKTSEKVSSGKVSNDSGDKKQPSSLFPSRRQFFSNAGAATLASSFLFAAACHKDNSSPGSTNTNYNFGTGDTFILNYAYALEQLEAAFYTQVIASPYTGITADETANLTDIMYHEIAHREFFKAALAGSAIGSLSVNFSSIDFTSRTSVLAAARSFEDLGVSAYNGAGQYLASSDYLTVAGKIVSVEARHAAYIRDLIQAQTFASGPDENSTTGASLIDSNGLDTARPPSQVLPIAGTFITTTIITTGIPG